jgi:hypothetical protein
MGAELFHADGWTNGRTDRNHDANINFSRFCERALKLQYLLNYSKNFTPIFDVNLYIASISYFFLEKYTEN